MHRKFFTRLHKSSHIVLKDLTSFTIHYLFFNCQEVSKCMPIISYMNHLFSSICSLRSTFFFKSSIIIFSAIPILSGCNSSNTIQNFNVTNEFRGIGNVDTRLDVYRKPLLEKCWEISVSQEEFNKIKDKGGSIIANKDWKEKVEFLPTHKKKWAKRTYSELSEYRDIYSKAECIGKTYTLRLPEQLVNKYIKDSKDK